MYVLQIIGLDEYRHRMDTRVERLGRSLEDAGVFNQLDATKAIGPINRSAAHCLEDGPHRKSISAVRRHLDDAEPMNGCLPIQRTAARENGAVDIRRERPPACLPRDDGQRRLPCANQPAAFVRSQAEIDTVDSKRSIRRDNRNSRCLSLLHERSQGRTPGIGVCDDESFDFKSVEDGCRRADLRPAAAGDQPDIDRPSGRRQRPTERLRKTVGVGPGVDQKLMPIRGSDQHPRSGSYIQGIDVHPTIGLNQQQPDRD